MVSCQAPSFWFTNVQPPQWSSRVRKYLYILILHHQRQNHNKAEQ